jgi:N-acyl-D-aspartate/D-glutamate deacylase
MDLMLDWLLEENGKAILMNAFENYFDGDLEVVRTLLEDEATISGIADAGAHVGFVCDAGSPTSMLTHWVKQRKRGKKLPIEFLVKKQTSDTARAFGLRDRGLIAAGYKADFNLIEFDALRVLKPTIEYDLPAGGRRILQRAEGYRYTFVSGVETLRGGEFTGELPGRLVRGAR